MAGLMDVLRKLEAARQLRTSDEQRYGRESRPPSKPQGTLTAGGAPVRSAAGNVGTEFGTAPVAQPSAGGGIPQQLAPPPTSAAPPPAPTTTFIPPDVKAAQPELAGAESVPFNPEALDPGTALEAPQGQEHEGGLYAPPEEGTYADGMMNTGGDQAEGDEGPIDLGVLPAVKMYPPLAEGEEPMPGEAEEEQRSMDLAMQELAARMLRQGSGARGGRRQVPPAF